MDYKKNIFQAMVREGPASTTRRHVTKNIRRRLKEEASREGKTALDAHYACVSIRKNLVAMANARRDLNSAMLHSQKTLGEEDESEKYCILHEAFSNLEKRLKESPEDMFHEMLPRSARSDALGAAGNYSAY